MLEPFGPNVVSTEGDLWRLHQRITVPSLGEGVNKLVWTETFRQTEMMVSPWVSAVSSSLKTDIYSLTINVMSGAAFGQRAEWSETGNIIPPGHKMSLVAAVYGLVMHLPHILLLPKGLLKLFFPDTAYRSYVEYDKYISEFHQKEKARLERDSNYESSLKGNLLTAILKSNLTDQKDTSVKGRTTLTDKEILGNSFIFLLAGKHEGFYCCSDFPSALKPRLEERIATDCASFPGYDTTANTILFCSITLALYDRIQDKLIEEIDMVWTEAQRAGRKELSYTEDLPKFRYTLAFMVRRPSLPCAIYGLARMLLKNPSSSRLCVSSQSSFPLEGS